MSNDEVTGIENVDPREDGAQEQVVVQKSQKEIEKEQEVLLRSKYPAVKGPGTSLLLQKRLSSKGTKYFDSGDYAMAKAKAGVLPKPATAAPATEVLPDPLPDSTGQAIPTPDTVPPKKMQRQTSRLASQS